jgi:hypothetical protein
MSASFGVPRPARRKPETCSRVGNGNVLLPMTDGRSLTARRFQDLYEDVANDLGGLDQGVGHRFPWRLDA